ncbi:hypothetical protein [Micromonospora avicenniae]|uniref:hypothetical protein n=1 Tax=Micromonospora avicenniae TaxID=1198245 RepID=UPI00331D7DCD
MSAVRCDRDLLEEVLSRTGRRRGETVPTLAMLDAYPAEWLPDTPPQDPGDWRRLQRGVHEFGAEADSPPAALRLSST